MFPTKKIPRLLDSLSRGLPEKEDALAIGLLTLLAGESLFLLGPPGVAKSLLARRLKFAFAGARAFEYLMGRFSTPEEIFGPLSIAGLRDRDVFERKTEGYLPEADIAFLDEIWRASSPIQNALLTILNEKVYRNGGREIKVPLKGLIGASNRLPENEESAEAFWDRFLVRLEIGPLEDAQAFKSMVSDASDLYAPALAEEEKISASDWAALQTDAAQVRIPDSLLDLILRLRSRIGEGAETPDGEGPTPWDFYVSDRRWKKIVHLIRVSSALHGREEADLMDVFLLIPCLWNTPAQIDLAESLVKAEVQALGYPIPVDLTALETEFRLLNRELLDLTRTQKSVERRVPTLENGEYFTVEGFDPLRSARIWSEDYPLLETSKDLECEVYFFEKGSFESSEKLPLRATGTDAQVKIAGEVFTLTNHTVWQNVLTTITPDPQALKTWADKASVLAEFLRESQQTLLQTRQDREQAAQSHLFVPADYIPATLTVIDKASRDLASLIVRADRLAQTQTPETV